MYNKQAPYNELRKLPPQFNFDDIEILKLVNKANIALAGLNGTAKLLPSRFLILEPLSVREAVASSGVENINTTVSEVFRAELFPEKDATKSQKETLHYKDCLIDGLKIVKEKGIFTTNDYIKIQASLEPDKQGIRKISDTKEPVRIANTDSKEIIYTPPAGENLLRDFLKNYEGYYNDFSNDDNIDPLIKMALLHYQFEAIHPFRDGNGRTGRILMVLYLVLAKRIDLPILFISGYILKHRNEYYQHLKAVTEDGGWKEWVIFILNAVIAQSVETEDTIMKIKKLIINYKKMAEDKSKHLPESSKFIDYIFSKPTYTYNDLAKKMNIHRNTAIKYIESLVENKILEKTKYKREFVFYHPKFIDLL